MNEEKELDREAAHHGFFRRNVGPLILVGALAVTGGVGGLTWHNQHSDLSAQQAQIRDLQTTIDTSQSQSDKRIDEDVADALGISRQRLRSDESTIDDLVNVALSWDSGEAYEQARKTLVDRYDIDPKSQLLTKFLGPQKVNYDKDKKKVYYIDTAGLNSSVDSDPDVQIVRVRGTDYTYDVTVEVRASSDAVKQGTDSRGAPIGGNTSQRTMKLRVTIDDDGNVTSASGDAAHDQTRRSDT